MRRCHCTTNVACCARPDHGVPGVVGCITTIVRCNTAKPAPPSDGHSLFSSDSLGVGRVLAARGCSKAMSSATSSAAVMH